MFFKYEDFRCSITESSCERDSLSECPEKVNNLLVPCKYFTEFLLPGKSLSHTHKETIYQPLQ